MKNLILLMTLVVGFAVHAETKTTNSFMIPDDHKNASVSLTEVNTFCKLIAKGDIEAVKSMIAAGTNINQKSVGMTPLMYAARYNKVDIVNLLISKGANLKTKSNRGYTALEYAEMSKALEAYKIISKHLYTKMEKRKKASI